MSTNEKPPIQTPPEVDENYQIMADKIGFVPNTRPEDNRFQAKFIGISVLICASVGAIVFQTSDTGPFYLGAVLGLLAGAVCGLLFSGTILAIKNLKR